MKKSSLHFLFCFFYWAVEKEIRGSRFGAIELFALMIVFFIRIQQSSAFSILLFVLHFDHTNLQTDKKKLFGKFINIREDLVVFFFHRHIRSTQLAMGLTMGWKTKIELIVTISRQAYNANEILKYFIISLVTQNVGSPGRAMAD